MAHGVSQRHSFPTSARLFHVYGQMCQSTSRPPHLLMAHTSIFHSSEPSSTFLRWCRIERWRSTSSRAYTNSHSHYSLNHCFSNDSSYSHSFFLPQVHRLLSVYFFCSPFSEKRPIYKEKWRNIWDLMFFSLTLCPIGAFHLCLCQSLRCLLDAVAYWKF